MKAVVLESDGRPVEDVVFGPGGMEQNRRRKGGVLGVNIRLQGAAVFAKTMGEVAAKLGADFEKAMRQVSLTTTMSREQMDLLEATLLERRQLGKSKIRRAFIRLQWEIERASVRMEQEMISCGEAILPAVSRVRDRLRSWWALLCR